MNPQMPKAQIDALLNYKSEFFEIMLRGYSPGGGRGMRGGGQRGGAATPNEALDKFKQDTYLLKKNKEKILLANLVPPRGAGGGYFLQFPRTADGKPTLTPEDKEVTLVIRIGDNVFRYVFKFDKMMVKGNLEL